MQNGSRYQRRFAALGLTVGALLLVGAGCGGQAEQQTTIDLGNGPRPGSTTINANLNTSTGADVNAQVNVNTNRPTNTNTSTNTNVNTSTNVNVNTPPPSAVKEFSIAAHQSFFVPNQITVKQGDRVRLKITSVDVTHGFSMPAYNVSETLNPNQTVTVEFTADQKGTFPFFCTVFCGAGHGSMTGQMVVE